MQDHVEQSPLKAFFDKQKKGSFYNYVLVLIRPKGVSRMPDPLWVAHTNATKGGKVELNTELANEALSLVFNLNEHERGGDYNPFPFLGKSLADIKLEVTDALETNGNIELSKEITDLFPDEIGAAYETSDKLSDFLKDLASYYFEARLFFKPQEKPLFVRLPGFEVLEVLRNETYGMYGFNVYFSNGSKANYERTGEKTTGINLLTSYPINYMVGDIARLKRQWMVEEKHDFEIGMEGRYNDWGEWMPLVYPGEHEEFLKESKRIADGDEDVAGALFYVMCTGHRIIEFAFKTPIEMPDKFFSFGSKMHLHKCEQSNQLGHATKDFHIYDGHYDLDDLDKKTVRTAIASINIGLNRMAFAYDSSVEWCLKYSIYRRGGYAKPTPSKEELRVLNSLLVDFPDTEDAIILDMSIDWFHRGEQARRKNEFLAFLCYYIALECVAIAVADGDADLGLGFHKESKEGRIARIKNEIGKLHDELYLHDPQKFVEKAYFEQVTGLKVKTKKVVEIVFGKDHKYIKALFERNNDKESLSDLRGRLAHGGFTLLDYEHKEIIGDRLAEMAEISREFLRKIIVKPGQKLPEWKGGHSFAMFPSDPRDMMIANNPDMYLKHDWRIKTEWFD